jgi:hypothetical protein
MPLIEISILVDTMVNAKAKINKLKEFTRYFLENNVFLRRGKYVFRETVFLAYLKGHLIC